MIRNLKALGLALCAVFVFGAFSASGASAEETDLFTSPVQDTYLTGTQIGGIGAGNVFNTKWAPNAKMECATATYAGTFLGNAVEEISLTPSYGGCKIGGVNATVHDEGCKYVLTGRTDLYIITSGAEGEDATISLDCGDTGQIRITGPLGCIITLKDTHPSGTKVSQNRLGVRYDNEEGGGKWDVKVTFTVDRIAYTSSGCGFLGITATDADTNFTQSITLKGYSNAAHTAQVDLAVS